MKSIKKVVFPIMIGLALVIGMQSASHASPVSLTLDDGTTRITVSGFGGVVTYTGSIGNWDISASTGITYPIYGTEGQPRLDLISLDAVWTGDNNLKSTLLVTVSQDLYTYTSGGAIFEIGGTTNGSIEATAWSGQNEFQLATQLGDTLRFGGGAFSGTTWGGTPDTSNYSLTIQAAITQVGSGATSFNASLAVPEPFTLIFLGSCLLGAGMVSRKFKI